MRINFLFMVCSMLLTFGIWAQEAPDSPLKIDQIMQGQKFIGYSPENIRWSLDSRSVFFDWNPDQELLPSLYEYDLQSGKITKVSPDRERTLASPRGTYNQSRTHYLYTENGDIYIHDLGQGERLQVTHTLEREYAASWGSESSEITFRKGNDLFSWNRETGSLKQLTHFTERSSEREESYDEQQQWLKEDQMALFEELRKMEEISRARENKRESMRPPRPREIVVGKDRISHVSRTPDGTYIFFIQVSRTSQHSTKVPHFVTEDGFLDIENARAKVGTPQPSYQASIYDPGRDTVYQVDTHNLPGIRKKPEFMKTYHNSEDPYHDEYDEPKPVVILSPEYSREGRIMLTLRSQDNKDRWLALLDPENGTLESLVHQHDEAWIGGPGISSWNSSKGNQGWIDENLFYFQSEETGYSHLYTVNVKNGKIRQLTNGAFEVTQVYLSHNRENFYLTTSKADPGERHLYRMSVKGGKMERLTKTEGHHDVYISPDETYFAIRYSSSNTPWELAVMENQAGSEMRMVTDSRTEAFKSYDWRVPELVYFEADDGARVRARLYQPSAAKKNGAAVLFVHGAGYLQNVHKWWSSYFREYMFHNMLADHGYTVLDIDYRGSAGYGRDWRTGIYRHMGGKDLSDQVDGAEFLVREYGIDANRIGIYGGSYGGFITLMAMFTTPEVFRCGAALRSVTDWAHYNHGYTSNILNTPVADSLAYRRSSPLYHAEGLQGQLLMLHGMVDANVQFQDIVRLSQRLIELGKEDWDLAVFPVEDHGFSTVTGWTDEYRRIFRLFRDNLQKE